MTPKLFDDTVREIVTLPALRSISLRKNSENDI